MQVLTKKTAHIIEGNKEKIAGYDRLRVKREHDLDKQLLVEHRFDFLKGRVDSLELQGGLNVLNPRYATSLASLAMDDLRYPGDTKVLFSLDNDYFTLDNSDVFYTVANNNPTRLIRFPIALDYYLSERDFQVVADFYYHTVFTLLKETLYDEVKTYSPDLSRIIYPPSASFNLSNHILPMPTNIQGEEHHSKCRLNDSLLIRPTMTTLSPACHLDPPILDLSNPKVNPSLYDAIVFRVCTSDYVSPLQDIAYGLRSRNSGSSLLEIIDRDLCIISNDFIQTPPGSFAYDKQMTFLIELYGIYKKRH